MARIQPPRACKPAKAAERPTRVTKSTKAKKSTKSLANLNPQQIAKLFEAHRKYRGDKPASFNLLPPEVREKIYKYVLPVRKVFSSLAPPELASVSRTVRNEVTPLYYSKNSFVFNADVYQDSDAEDEGHIRWFGDFDEVAEVFGWQMQFLKKVTITATESLNNWQYHRMDNKMVNIDYKYTLQLLPWYKLERDEYQDCITDESDYGVSGHAVIRSRDFEDEEDAFDAAYDKTYSYEQNSLMIANLTELPPTIQSAAIEFLRHCNTENYGFFLKQSTSLEMTAHQAYLDEIEWDQREAERDERRRLKEERNDAREERREGRDERREKRARMRAARDARENGEEEEQQSNNADNYDDEDHGDQGHDDEDEELGYTDTETDDSAFEENSVYSED